MAFAVPLPAPCRGQPRAGPLDAVPCAPDTPGWWLNDSATVRGRRYILRRSREGFRQAAVEKDGGKLAQNWQRAVEELDVVRRQSLVYQMYGRKHKNVLVSLGRGAPAWQAGRAARSAGRAATAGRTAAAKCAGRDRTAAEAEPSLLVRCRLTAAMLRRPLQEMDAAKQRA